MKKMGRPTKVIDLQQLAALCQIQCTDEEIAAVLDVTTELLRRRKKNKEFLAVMEQGKARGKASLRRKQFEAAMAGDRVMLIWLGKQLLGQTEKLETQPLGVSVITLQWQDTPETTDHEAADPEPPAADTVH
jgi:hypothetical protein